MMPSRFWNAVHLVALFREEMRYLWSRMNVAGIRPDKKHIDKLRDLRSRVSLLGDC